MKKPIFVNAQAIDYSGGDQIVSPPSVGLYIGGTGALKVDMANGATVTFTAMPVGLYDGISVKKIYQTGSTATNSLILR